jgi:hypothetical protein
MRPRGRKWPRSQTVSASGKTSKSRKRFNGVKRQRHRLLAIGFQTRVDERDLRADCRVTQAALRGNAPAHRRPHAKPFGFDQVGFGGKTDELDGMAAEQALGSEQRAIGRR